jgi:hypothetical protein
MLLNKIFSFGPETRLSYRSLTPPHWAACLLLAWWAAQPSVLNAQEQAGQTQARTSSIIGVPSPLGGTNPQLLPTSAGEVRNVIRGGLTVGALYDDNAIDVNGQRHDGYQYSVSPSLSLQQTRPSTEWSLNYRGGLTVDHKALEASPSIQNATAATADVQHTFGRRLLLELRDDYSFTNNPFGYTGESLTLPAVSGAGQLNSFVAAPAATRIANVSSANLNYQLSQHSSLGFSGSFSTQRFRDVATAPGVALSLIDTRTTTGRGFYALEISQRQKIGAEYQLQDLRFRGNAARTVDQTVFLFDEIAFTPNITLILFAGPDCAHTHDNILVLGSTASPTVLPVMNDLWSPAGGATFMWRARYVALGLSGQRVVTDGSGSTGAVRATSASAELRKDFTTRWSVSLGYIYSDERLLEGLVNTANSRITVEQGTLVLERRIAEHLSVRTQYARIQQVSAGTPAPLTTGNHNRVGVELAYQFTRPLGR